MSTEKVHNERALIARLEAANTAELARLILNASAAEETVLRVYLGNERFRRMRNLVLRREMSRDNRHHGKRPNVVVIPGTLGCEMSSVHQQQRERIWLSPTSIVAGHLARLQLDANGLTEADPNFTVQITGVMKRPYGELMLALAEHANVQAFAYDWRKDLRLAAGQLQAQIENWFPAGEPVHLVAHAAGGLVARAYIHQFPERWALDAPPAQRGKLIMLGTPNYGLFTTPQALTGHLDLLRWIDLLDTYHDRADFREIVKSFPGLYQLLPTPDLDFVPGLDALYRATTYGPDLNVPQVHLRHAQEFHAMLSQAPVDPARMIYLGGHNQPTFVGLDVAKLQSTNSAHKAGGTAEMEYITSAYQMGMNGDGTVAHAMGVLRTATGELIPAFCTDVLHGDLASHPKVLLTISELLGALPTAYATTAQRCGLRPLTADLIAEPNLEALNRHRMAFKHAAKADQSSPHADYEALVRRVNSRGDAALSRNFVSVEEREIEERLMFGFLSGKSGAMYRSYEAIPLAVPQIQINLVSGDITDVELAVPTGNQAIDALAVGHYSGSKPHGILRTLDYKISRALAGRTIADGDVNRYEETAHSRAARVPDNELLLTQYTQRGTIRAELAQTFFLADPRRPERMLTVAGMGEPGRFGEPELVVLVRELCWALGQMNKRHLATVLIGTGRENLTVGQAVDAWVRGIKLAISGTESTAPKRSQPTALQEITFFITDPRKLILFDQALVREQARLQRINRLEIHYQPLTAAQIDRYEDEAIDYVKGLMERRRKVGSQPRPSSEPIPSRITVSVEGDTYRFGAVTDSASIPEREIPLDPTLVKRANDELAAAADSAQQLDLGQFIQRLLIPADLRCQLTTSAPLVMMLDQTTARIHWELLALSDRANEQGAALPSEEPHLRFLGTSRGFTRQLRTIHAPPPEPPPPTQRHLRVLVVADPAADAHLPGAEEEGIAVADLFEQFNIAHAENSTKNRVEVVRLFGPREATRTTVLRHLMMRTYDVLHFAGHCTYDAEHPARSGWIFSNGERLSAHELTRIDRSPSFVFSNCCESGVTPARSDERSVDLAPSFAESFFARGVTNFVCTAWPVEDRAARDFALTLYAGLLGLEPNQRSSPAEEAELPHSSTLHSTLFQPTVPLPMHQAMMLARRAIATPPSDTRTWGAYQHYGNPYFRFFDPAGMGATEGVHSPKQEARRKKAAQKERKNKENGATAVRPTKRNRSAATSKNGEAIPVEG